MSVAAHSDVVRPPADPARHCIPASAASYQDRSLTQTQREKGMLISPAQYEHQKKT